ncbi:hypothetical protein Tco_0343923 [Tanacetum coccineum]
MAGLLFNKSKGDRVRVLLVRELKEMLQALGEIMLQDRQGLLNVTIAQESDQVLDEEQLIDNLDAYDSDYDDVSSSKAGLMANLLRYGSDVLFEVPQYDSYQNDDMVNQSVQET